MPNSPSPSASIQPTGAAKPPRGMPSISAISATAALVGVPPTAAEGWRAAASSRALAPARVQLALTRCWAGSCTTAVTSVARCMTLGRCSTNGASGRFIESQYGASESATERTAYSCSSRSFDDRARVAASGEVALVVAGATDRAGQHPRGDQAALASNQQLGRRAEQPVDVEGPAHGVGRGEPAQRPAHVDRLVGGGDQVPREHHLLQLAGVDAGDRVARRRLPRSAVEGAVGEDDAGRAGRAVASARGTSTEARRRADRRHPGGSPRRPTTTRGTTSADSPGSSANPKLPKHTSPLPGTSTPSRTTAASRSCATRPTRPRSGRRRDVRRTRRRPSPRCPRRGAARPADPDRHRPGSRSTSDPGPGRRAPRGPATSGCVGRGAARGVALASRGPSVRAGAARPTGPVRTSRRRPCPRRSPGRTTTGSRRSRARSRSRGCAV